MKWFWWLVHRGRLHRQAELEDLPSGTWSPFARSRCVKCGRIFIRPSPEVAFDGGTYINDSLIYGDDVE